MQRNGYGYVSDRIPADQLGLRWLSGITRWDTAKAVRAEPHRHSYIELIFCLHGELSYRIDGHGTVKVSDGSGIVIPKNAIHVLGGGTDTPCERIGLHIETKAVGHSRYSVFSPSDIRNFCKTLTEMAGRPFRLDSTLHASVRRLVQYIRRNETLSSAERGFVRALCGCILFQTIDILRKPLVAPRPQMMDVAVEFIERHYGEDFHLENLIRHIGYGRTRLFTLFKRHTGLTPNEYLVRLRIRKARELVDKGQTESSTVAKAVGFNDPAYFKRVYRRYTGVDFAPPQHLSNPTHRIKTASGLRIPQARANHPVVE